jgi:alkylhydroperoxidase family enzyme
MSRIEPVNAPYRDDVAKTFERLMPPGMEPLKLFRTVAHNPRVLKRMQRGGLLDAGSISIRQREIAILRTCSLCEADYEWSVHAAIFAKQANLDEAALQATAGDPDESSWTEDERLILKLCDALHRDANIDDTLYEALRGVFDEAQIVELVMLAGLYHAVSFIVNVSGVEQEAWARGSIEQ